MVLFANYENGPANSSRCFVYSLRLSSVSFVVTKTLLKTERDTCADDVTNHNKNVGMFVITLPCRLNGFWKPLPQYSNTFKIENENYE